MEAILGGVVDLSKVPIKMALDDYQILVSESQERMLIVATEENKEAIFNIFNKWNLEYAVIGNVTNDGMYKVINEKLVFDKSMTEFEKVESVDWPTLITPKRQMLPIKEKRIEMWQVYDSTIGSRTLKGPDKPGSYSILNIPEVDKKICITWGFNFDDCYKNQLTLEYIPLAVVNCLNYGHPKDCMGDLKEFLDDLTVKCRKHCVPVIGGNVSLYNKTDDVNIYPSPTLVMIGINKI